MIVEEQVIVVCQGCSRGTAALVVQPKKSSRVVNLSQQRMTRLLETLNLPSHPAFDTTSERIVVHPPQTITFPSPSTQTFISVVNPNSSSEGVGKELSVEMTHALSLAI